MLEQWNDRKIDADLFEIGFLFFHYFNIQIYDSGRHYFTHYSNTPILQHSTIPVFLAYRPAPSRARRTSAMSRLKRASARL